MNTIRQSVYTSKQKGIVMGVIACLLSLMVLLIFYLRGTLRTTAIGIFSFIVLGLVITAIWVRRSEINLGSRSGDDIESGYTTATVTEADMGLNSLEPLPKYELPPKYEPDNINNTNNNGTIIRNQSPSQTVQ